MPFLGDLLRLFMLKRFDPMVEAFATSLEGRKQAHNPRRPVGRSNLGRSLALVNHGGVYTDMDAVALRGLGALFDAPRLSHELCSSWSASRPCGNSAVLGREQAGETARKLSGRCAALGSCWAAIAHNGSYYGLFDENFETLRERYPAPSVVRT